jgi:hypothetical protein
MIEYVSIPPEILLSGKLSSGNPFMNPPAVNGRLFKEISF